MPWVRWGDTSANHPIVLNVIEHEAFDDRLLNEVHGFISRCAAQAGAHTTDYLITRGTAVLIGGASRVDLLLDVAKDAGYLTEVAVDGRTVYKLVDDDPDFLHLRLKEEIDWEKQRKLDNSNPALIVPVRIRDGDGCRWCGDVVDWNSRTGGRSGTYDHLAPGQPATIDTYVVCCRSCNSSRKDGAVPAGSTGLLPEPSSPYYSPHTITWLTNNEWRQRNGYEVPPRPRRVITPGNRAPGLPPAATETPGQRTDTPSVPAAPAGQRPGTQPENAAVQRINPVDAPAQRTDTPSADATSPRPGSQPEHAISPGDDQREPPACQNPDRTGQGQTGEQGTDPVRTGRGGTGRDGSGRDGSPDLSTQPTTRQNLPRASSRGRRRRRSRNTTGTTPPTIGDHQ